jgi:CheY-like chemotaxis protein
MEKPSSAEKKKILLVEDNPGDVLLLTDMFQKFSDGEFELTRADSVESALSLIYREKFSAILLDLSLPLFLGLEPLVRVHKARPKLPIFVLSGYNDPDLAEEAKRIGARDYFCKNRLNGDFLVQELRALAEPDTPRNPAKVPIHFS